MKKKPVYVVGHKNPDTDSICSAVAYAELKNKLGDSEKYIAKRTGHISSETAFVLDYFKVPIPQYINDVKMQVQDAVIEEGIRIDRQMSLKKAWGLLKEHDVSTLAVVDQKNQLEGLVTIGDIAKSFMGVYGSAILSDAKTSYKNIIETLNCRLIVGDEEQVVTKGKVIVAAANPDLMEDYIDEGDIVLLGDRYESQLCAIEMNASCLIVCIGGEISDAIIALAEEKGCTIMSTDYDTFIAARLLNQSIPIEYFMVKENLATFKAEDYVEDIKEIMAEKRHRNFPVLNQQGAFIGTLSRHSLLDIDKKKVILVDHNERSQAVDGVSEAEILEIIDHHKLGKIETLKPVYFRNQPVGCTSTIVYLMYKENQVEIDQKMAGLMCSAILSDTLMYRSPTCTPIDKIAAEELAKIAGIDSESYATEMFDAGSDLKSKSAEDIFYQDFKKFSVGDITFGVGQITSIRKEELALIKESMLNYMNSIKDKHGVDMIYFMLTDIISEDTDLLCVGDGATAAIEKAYKQEVVDHMICLPKVVSRKKQFIPKLMMALQG